MMTFIALLLLAPASALAHTLARLGQPDQRDDGIARRSRRLD